MREFKSPQIFELESEIYLVTGADQIFLLGDRAEEQWARLLTSDEIKRLPFDIYWEGPALKFEADSKMTTELSKFTKINKVHENAP